MAEIQKSWGLKVGALSCYRCYILVRDLKMTSYIPLIPVPPRDTARFLNEAASDLSSTVVASFFFKFTLWIETTRRSRM
jgi:hypothetical protein